MSWTLLDSDTATFADGNAGHTYTFPGAAAAGNLIVLGLNSNTTITTPTGYTAAETDVGNQGAYVYYKVASGGETSVSVTTSGNHNTALSFLRYSGADTSAPLDKTADARVINNSTPQASPSVSPASLTGSNTLCLLYGMVHNSGSATAISGVTASTGYTSLLTTSASGGLNSATAALHFVIGRTDGSGLQTPSVSWSGGAWENRTAIFVSFILGGAQTVTTNSVASAESFGSPTVTGGGAILISPGSIASEEAFGTASVHRLADDWTLTTDYPVDYHQSPDPFRPWRPGNRLRYRIGIGGSFLRIGGVWRVANEPSVELLATAEKAYAGGRIHTISADEAMQLIDQGFEDYVVREEV